MDYKTAGIFTRWRVRMSFRLLTFATELGIDFFDTASVYGESEARNVVDKLTPFNRNLSPKFSPFLNERLVSCVIQLFQT